MTFIQKTTPLRPKRPSLDRMIERSSIMYHAATRLYSSNPPMNRQVVADAGVTKEALASIEVVGGSSRVPAVIRAIADYFGKEPSRTLNAKECVSRGAALQCAMLSPIFR